MCRSSSIERYARFGHFIPFFLVHFLRSLRLICFGHFYPCHSRCLFGRLRLGDLDMASVRPDRGAIALLVCFNRTRLDGGGWVVAFHKEPKKRFFVFGGNENCLLGCWRKWRCHGGLLILGNIGRVVGRHGLEGKVMQL